MIPNGMTSTGRNIHIHQSMLIQASRICMRRNSGGLETNRHENKPWRYRRRQMGHVHSSPT